jgi:hypothetical protein
MSIHRGDADIVIGGKTYRLRLTLGALARIEDALGAGDFERLREKLKSPSIADLLLILHALIEGGGERLALEVLKAGDVEFADAARAIGAAFRSLGPDAGKAEAAKAVAASETGSFTEC